MMLEFALGNPEIILVISLFLIFSTYYTVQSIIEGITNVRIAKYTGKLPGEETEEE